MNDKKSGALSTKSIDPHKICHDLNSALNKYRYAFEMFEETEPDLVSARTIFASAEKKLSELHDFFSKLGKN